MCIVTGVVDQEKVLLSHVLDNENYSPWEVFHMRVHSDLVTFVDVFFGFTSKNISLPRPRPVMVLAIAADFVMTGFQVFVSRARTSENNPFGLFSVLAGPLRLELRTTVLETVVLPIKL